MRSLLPFHHASAPVAGATLLSCLLGAFVVADAAGNTRRERGAAANTPPAVTPDNAFVQRASLQQHREIFTVTNPGTTPASFTLEAFCRTSQVNTCVPSATSLTLAAGASAAVSVSYSTGQPAGFFPSNPPRVVLRATRQDNALADSGWIRIGVTAASPGTPGEAGENTLLDRSSCIVANAGAGAAYECGDLRLVHVLPSTRVLNASRTPVLLYNSQHARPFPIVAAYYKAPSISNPLVDVSQVRAVLRLARGDTASRSWPGWGTIATRRVAVGMDASHLPTGIYDYTLEVSATYSNGTTSSATIYSGRFVVVNRVGSPFGAGWWMAGVESLAHLADGSKLWIGGDGSTRVYRVTPIANSWAADRFTRPDTLTFDAAAREYVRTLPGRAEVRFDEQGRHVRTINRLRHESVFTWSSGRLARIDLPRVNGVFNSGHAYTFEYGNNGGTRLSRVVSPGPVDYRYTQVATDGDGRITQFTDPDLTTVGFGYETGSSSARVRTRTDRRGYATTFAYDAGWRLAGSTHGMGTVTPADDIVFGFQAAESRGVAASVTSATTVLDGPRTDVPDLHTFYVDRYGMPWQVTNPLGASTTIRRADLEWPARVTSVRYHNGREVTATHDVRGNVLAVTDWATQRDGRAATTFYEWDTYWDVATRVTLPEGEVTTVGYDSVGRREWVQPGTDASRRVTFVYNPNSYSLAPGLLQEIRYPDGGVESYVYGGFGNLATVRSPLGFETEMLLDRIGRTVRVRTPIDAGVFQTDSTVYDLGDLARHTESWGPAWGGAPAERVVVDNDYDLAGNLLSVARRSEPDPAAIGTVVTLYAYDPAGRRIRETAPDTTPASAADNPRDSTVYDAAGNAVRQYTRRGHLIQMTYDELNRMTQRIVPEARYARRMEGIAKPRIANIPNPDRPPYPLFPTDPATGEMVVRADTVTLGYDVNGNLVRADNRYARIKRTYYDNGALRTDSTRLLTVAEVAQGGSFDLHVYGLEHTYDLNGRRTELRHPSQLAPQATGVVQDRTRWTYDPLLGTLAEVTDPLGNRFYFGYGVQGELATLTYPGSIQESFAYDRDGRLARDQIYLGATGLRHDTLTYDRRGKLLTERNRFGLRDTAAYAYSGLGHVRSHGRTYRGVVVGTGVGVRYSEYSLSRMDALTNVDSIYNSTTLTASDGSFSSTSWQNGGSVYERYTGRLRRTRGGSVTDTLKYDVAGSVIFQTQGRVSSGAVTDRAMFYGADGRMAASDVRRVDDVLARSAPYYATFEEYRYDALGRRVWVRAQRDCSGVPDDRPCSFGRVRRVVWDGDSELYEIQMPDYFSSTAELENDTGAARALGRWDGFDPNPFWGRVAYTYGLALDKPLSVVRMKYADHQAGQSYYLWPEDFALVPRWNTRGQADQGGFGDGLASKCRTVNGAQRCVLLDWPAAWFPYNPAPLIPEHWHGGLIHEKRDQSGLFYRRNRYYDPGTGRFTQEDPIGLAGGLNVYGFAAGDPVSYADPYGLCPERLKRNGRCPGGLDDDAEWDIVQGSINTLRPGAERDRLQEMLENGRIVRVQQTSNGTPTLAILGWRSGHSIQVADGFFTGNAPGYETGYDTPGERGWSLGHELGHFVQWEEGRLISEIGNSDVRSDRDRIRRLMEAQAVAENPELQRDADIMGCRLATDPGIWADKC